MQDAGYGTATQVVPMPGIAGPVPGTLASVDDFLVSKAHPEHKEAITRFLDYVLTPQNSVWFANIHGTLPLTQAGVDAERTQNAAVAPFLTQLAQVEWLPTRNPAWPAVQKSVGGTLAKALTGDPQTILAKIQAVAMAASPSR
jgi:ABC-type glycerol-3-phosphate transport system substrate-binding protein